MLTQIINILCGERMLSFPRSSTPIWDLISQMVQICGELPNHLLDKWKQLSPKDDGNSLEVRDLNLHR